MYTNINTSMVVLNTEIFLFCCCNKGSNTFYVLVTVQIHTRLYKILVGNFYQMSLKGQKLWFLVNENIRGFLTLLKCTFVFIHLFTFRIQIILYIKQKSNNSGGRKKNVPVHVVFSLFFSLR